MEYKVTVATGTLDYSGTKNYVYLTLVGENGESEKTLLDNPGWDLYTGAVGEYVVRSSAPLGRLLLVRLEKQSFIMEDNWFCSYVKVTPPGGETTQTFPCYCWLVGDTKVEVRDGTAKKLSHEILPQELAHRKAELQERQKTLRWKTWETAIPKCIDADSVEDLPQDLRFADEKRCDFALSLGYAYTGLALKKLVIGSLNDPDDFKQIFWKITSPVAEFTMENWKEDWFFGYQLLNGPNPRMIRICKKLPSNFPVSGDMVQSFLSPRTTLDEELKAGNIYLVDYAILDRVPANEIDGKMQHIAAPLCLLYEHPDHGLIPIAIQLEQNPSEVTPIFLPQEPHLAWLLAKMWVRHAEFQIFQVLSHLLRTHLLAEVFCVATLRHLPTVHPINKLLSPHLKYTLEINVRARTQLISRDGIFKQVVSTGGEGLLVLSQREYKVLTYSSLQPRWDFKDRGVNKLKNYFYRDYSLLLWDAIEKFVNNIVSLYYGSDSEVVQDSELQAWIKDVVEEGFANTPQFGLPNKLKSKQELITLLSVIIFTSSAQHAAVNNGQFDFCSCVPNTPCTMRQPPPKGKDNVTMKLIMDTLPDVNQSCTQLAITWLLGRAQPDAIPLAQYKEQYFTEPAAQKMIDIFRQDLKDIEKYIEKQNKAHKLPYLYLCPSRIENSITI